jgi:photosystem II P680 reaction center D1 protein
MTATIATRSILLTPGNNSASGLLQPNNRIYVGWFGVLMIPCLACCDNLLHYCISSVLPLWTLTAFVNQLLVLLCTETTSSLVPLFLLLMLLDFTSILSGKLLLDEWLYNGGPFQLVVFHFLIGIYAYMGREWELSYRLGMRPWIMRCLLCTCCCCECRIPGLSFRSRFFL